jgi:hypothetical protein
MAKEDGKALKRSAVHSLIRHQDGDEFQPVGNAKTDLLDDLWRRIGIDPQLHVAPGRVREINRRRGVR